MTRHNGWMTIKLSAPIPRSVMRNWFIYTAFKHGEVWGKLKKETWKPGYKWETWNSFLSAFTWIYLRLFSHVCAPWRLVSREKLRENWRPWGFTVQATNVSAVLSSSWFQARFFICLYQSHSKHLYTFVWFFLWALLKILKYSFLETCASYVGGAPWCSLQLMHKY